jgi:hypothetical protein
MKTELEGKPWIEEKSGLKFSTRPPRSLTIGRKKVRVS